MATVIDRWNNVPLSTGAADHDMEENMPLIGSDTTQNSVRPQMFCWKEGPLC